MCGRIQRNGQTFNWVSASELNSNMEGYCDSQNDWPCATWTPKFQKVNGEIDTHYIMVDNIGINGNFDINSQGNCVESIPCKCAPSCPLKTANNCYACCGCAVSECGGGQDWAPFDGQLCSAKILSN